MYSDSSKINTIKLEHFSRSLDNFKRSVTKKAEAFSDSLLNISRMQDWDEETNKLFTDGLKIAVDIQEELISVQELESEILDIITTVRNKKI